MAINLEETVFWPLIFNTGTLGSPSNENLSERKIQEKLKFKISWRQDCFFKKNIRQFRKWRQSPAYTVLSRGQEPPTPSECKVRQREENSVRFLIELLDTRCNGSKMHNAAGNKAWLYGRGRRGSGSRRGIVKRTAGDDGYCWVVSV